MVITLTYADIQRIVEDHVQTNLGLEIGEGGTEFMHLEGSPENSLCAEVEVRDRGMGHNSSVPPSLQYPPGVRGGDDKVLLNEGGAGGNDGRRQRFA